MRAMGCDGKYMTNSNERRKKQQVKTKKDRYCKIFMQIVQKKKKNQEESENKKPTLWLKLHANFPLGIIVEIQEAKMQNINSDIMKL